MMLKVEKKNPIYGIGNVSNVNILDKLKNFGVYQANDLSSRNPIRRDIGFAMKALVLRQDGDSILE